MKRKPSRDCRLFARLMVERWLDSLYPYSGEMPDEYLRFLRSQADKRHHNCYALALKLIAGA